MKPFALKGTILHAPVLGELAVVNDGYAVCENGVCAGVFPTLPEKYAGIETRDHTGMLIIPGLVDLHIHAPQYPNRGLGMDLELLPWLETYTFPEESRYSDPGYAGDRYGEFAADLAASFTTRACVFATIHVPATLKLMELLEKTGLKTFVGKVNMDRNCPDSLREATEVSLDDTRRWLDESAGKFRNTMPIVTPRFIPTCSDGLMEGLGRLADEFGVPVQSHLSENRSEIAWVRELHPNASCYGGAYDRFGFMGSGAPSIMAHCVHPCPEEFELLKNSGLFVAHCPQSNTNLWSGVAPVVNMLRAGIKVGLGSDVSGGFSLSMLRAASDAVQSSKLRRALLETPEPLLTVAEAFYLATKGGGAFWGKAGSFEPGYEFDALVLDDAVLTKGKYLTPVQRLERAVYLSEGVTMREKYVAGRLANRRG